MGEIGNTATDDQIALAEATHLRWEKGVEAALARKFQEWFVLRFMRDFLSHETIAKLPITTDTKQARKEILDPLKTVLLFSQYIPLDGNTEKFLGDAIAVVNSKFILVECKQFLDKDGWEREALPRGVTMEKKPKAQKPNPNGKNRACLFQKLQYQKLGAHTLKHLSVNCHCLVGMKKRDDHNFPVTSKGAILQWTPYWSFICGEHEDFKGPYINPADIASMENGLGVDVDAFKQYIYCLLDEDIEGTTLEDVAWIEREMVIIEMQENKESGKTASLSYSIGAEDLFAKLGDNNSYNELIKKLRERRTALIDQKEAAKSLLTRKQGNAKKRTVKKD